MCIQKRLQRLATRDKIWSHPLYFDLFAHGTCSLTPSLPILRFGRTLYIRGSQLGVGTQTPNHLVQCGCFVHFLGDVSLADHGQKDDQLIVVLVHEHTSALLALLASTTRRFLLDQGARRRGAGVRRRFGGAWWRRFFDLATRDSRRVRGHTWW